MARSLEYPLTVEFPTTLLRWAAGFEVKFVDKELVLTPRPAAEAAYEAITVNPREVWKRFLGLPLGYPMRLIFPESLSIELMKQVLEFVEDYGPLTRGPLKGDAPPEVLPWPEWRSLQEAVRAVLLALIRRDRRSEDQDVLNRFVEIIDAMPHTLRVGDARDPRPRITYLARNVRAMILLGLVQDQVERTRHRQCVECGQWFEASRSDRWYCSTRCRVRRARHSSSHGRCAS